MSTPEHRGDGAPAAPTVRSAPAAGNSMSPDVAPGSRWWSAVPRHLGRARTSTVVLGLLFVGVFALYLNVRPPDPGRAQIAPEETVEQGRTVEEPVTTEPAEPSETETPAPTTPTPPPTTDSPSPTSPPPAPTTAEPSSPGDGSGEPTAPETTVPAPAGGTEEGAVPSTSAG